MKAQEHLKMSVLFIIYLASILASAITAFIFRKSLRTRGLIILVPYLFYVFAQELSLKIFDLNKIIYSNTIIYNFYRPLSFFVFVIIYYFIPFMAPVRKAIIWMTGIYIMANVIIFLFFESIFQVSGYLVLIRGFAITLFATFFLFRYFHLDNRKEEEFWRPMVWITMGIVIFYPVISISTGFQKYLTAFHAKVGGFNLYNFIPQLLSIFMYSCFSYAFYLCKKNN